MFEELRHEITACIGPPRLGRNDRLEKETFRSRIDWIELRTAFYTGRHLNIITGLIDSHQEGLLQETKDWTEKLLSSLK